MKNYLKSPLLSLAVIMVLSMFVSCQTESISDEEEFSSKNSESVKTGISQKLVALYNSRNGAYISSEDGGNVTCNRKEIGAWETMTMITWEDGTISFKGNNGLFLSDENGADNVKFSREEAGLWEKFTYDGAAITRGDLTLNGSDYNVNFNGGAYWGFDIIDL